MTPLRKGYEAADNWGAITESAATSLEYTTQGGNIFTHFKHSKHASFPQMLK